MPDGKDLSGVLSTLGDTMAAGKGDKKAAKRIAQRGTVKAPKAGFSFTDPFGGVDVSEELKASKLADEARAATGPPPARASTKVKSTGFTMTDGLGLSDEPVEPAPHSFAPSALEEEFMRPEYRQHGIETQTQQFQHDPATIQGVMARYDTLKGGRPTSGFGETPERKAFRQKVSSLMQEGRFSQTLLLGMLENEFGQGVNDRLAQSGMFNEPVVPERLTGEQLAMMSGQAKDFSLLGLPGKAAEGLADMAAQGYGASPEDVEAFKKTDAGRLGYGLLEIGSFMALPHQAGRAILGAGGMEGLSTVTPEQLRKDPASAGLQVAGSVPQLAPAAQVVGKMLKGEDVDWVDWTLGVVGMAAAAYPVAAGPLRERAATLRVAENLRGIFPELDQSQAVRFAKSAYRVAKMADRGDVEGVKRYAEANKGKLADVWDAIKHRFPDQAGEPPQEPNVVPDALVAKPGQPGATEPPPTTGPVPPFVAPKVRSAGEIVADIEANGETTLTPAEGKQDLSAFSRYVQRTGLQTEQTPDGGLRVFTAPATTAAAQGAPSSQEPDKPPTQEAQPSTATGSQTPQATTEEPIPSTHGEGTDSDARPIPESLLVGNQAWRIEPDALHELSQNPERAKALKAAMKAVALGQADPESLKEFGFEHLGQEKVNQKSTIDDDVAAFYSFQMNRRNGEAKTVKTIEDALAERGVQPEEANRLVAQAKERHAAKEGFTGDGTRDIGDGRFEDFAGRPFTKRGPVRVYQQLQAQPEVDAKPAAEHPKPRRLADLSPESVAKLHKELSPDGNWGLTPEEYKTHETDTQHIHTPERQALRESIVDTAYGDGAAKKEKLAIFVTGGPASGKSRFIVDHKLLEENGAILVDPDVMKKALPEYSTETTGYVHDESSTLAGNLLERAVANGDNVVIPKLGGDPAKLKNQIDDLKAKGYTVKGVFIDVDPDTAVASNNARRAKGGHGPASEEFVRAQNKNARESFDVLSNGGSFDEHQKWTRDEQGFSPVVSPDGGSPPESVGDEVRQRAGEPGEGGRRDAGDLPGVPEGQGRSPEVTDDSRRSEDKPVLGDGEEPPGEPPAKAAPRAPEPGGGGSGEAHSVGGGGGGDAPSKADRPEGDAAAGGGDREGASPDTDDRGRPARRDAEDGEPARPAGDRGADYRLHELAEPISATSAGKSKDLLAAIKAMRAAKERGHATPEEQAVLIKFPGWGFDGSLLKPGTKSFESKVGQEIWSLLDNEQRKRAIMATRNSHYTSVEVVGEIWNALSHLGFKGGGEVLEPAAGTGLFFAAMPDTLEPSKWTMVELEPTTAEVAKLLYPGQKVVNDGYQNVRIPDGKFPLVVSNVPFDAPIGDASFFERFDAQTANALTARSHNYFFAKAVLNTRPGGIIAFVTSKGTLDNTMDAVAVREWLATQAEFIGAVRLPKTAFNASANTEVVTDVVFLRRRGHGGEEIETPWTKTKPVDLKNEDGEKIQYQLNEYFVDNPKMVLGTNSMTGTMRAKDEYTVEPKKHKSLGAQFAEAVANLPKDVFRPVAKAPAADLPEVEPPLGTKPGEVWADGKRILRLTPGGNVVELGAKELQRGGVAPKKGETKTDANRKVFIDYFKVKSALTKVLSLQEAPDAELKAAQEELRDAYADFKKRHGEFHTATIVERPATDESGKPILDEEGEPIVDTDVRFPYKPLLWQDTQAVRVFALELWNPDELKVDRLSDVFTKRTASTARQVEKVETADDALNASLNLTGRLDVPFMAALLGKSPEETLADLEGKVYRSPDGEYHDAESYLSGDVRGKLEAAKKALDAGDKDMARNVADLEKVLPEDSPYDRIYAPPGAAWMPEGVPAAFVKSLVGSQRSGEMPFTVLRVGSRWSVTKNVGGMTAREAEWAPYHDFGRFAEALLNDTPLNVYDKTEDGGKVLNQQKTDAANDKVAEAREQFSAWADGNPKVQDTIVRSYNDAVNRFRPKIFNGSRLTFPGLSPAVELRRHRVDAVDRAMRDKFTMWWHGVGSGKTYTADMLGMKLKQTGLRNKPVFVAYKPTLEQVIADAYKAYPNGNFLAAHQDSFSKGNREEFLSLMTTGDWDMVFVTQEQMRSLPLSEDAVRRIYGGLTDLAMRNAGFDTAADVEKAAKSRDVKTKEMARRLLKLMAEEDKAIAAARNATSGLTFDSMGIDHVIIDEAHMYKGLTVETAHTSLGLSDSSRALDLWAKLTYLREIDGGATLMTGTAVVNSGAEVFNLLRMLNPGSLADMGVSEFDDFASVFVRFGSEVEATVTGAYRQKERIRAFNNIQQLATLVSQSMDVVPTSAVAEIKLPRLRDRDGNVTDKPIVVVTSPTPAQRAAFADIEQRFRKVKDRMKEGDFPGKGEDNYLSLSTLGRVTSQDARFYDPSLPAEAGSKIEAVVREAASIYHEYAADKATQIIFMDFGVPGKAGKFDAYQAIIDGLVKAGVKRAEIASITDAKTPQQRVRLAARFRSGEIRILIGSRAKIGVGMNVQERLIAWHHVALGWNPAMVEQGDGRGIRFGNMWTDRGGVMKFVYINEATYDQVTASATMAKGNVITQFANALSGRAGDVRELEDLSDSEGAASMSEVVAVSTGDRRIIELVQASKDAAKANAVLANAERSRTTATSKAKFQRDIAEAAQHELTTAERNAKAVVDAGLDGKDPEIRLNGGTPEKPTELADKMIDLATKNRFATIGRVAQATLASDSESSEGNWRYTVVLKVPGMYENIVLVSWRPGGDPPKVASVKTKVKDAVKRVLDRPGHLKTEIERAKREAEAYDESAAKPPDAKLIGRLEAARKKVTELEFETGITMSMLDKGEVEGFGRAKVTSKDVGKQVGTEGGQATVLKENSSGWLLVDRAGTESVLKPGDPEYDAVKAQLDGKKPAPSGSNASMNAGSRADASTVPPDKGLVEDFADRVEQLVKLSKGGLNVNVWLEDPAIAERFGGLFMRGDKKYRYGRIRARKGLTDVQVAQVVSHDLGHAVHAMVSHARGIGEPGQPKASLTQLFGVDKAKGKVIQGELVALTRALEGDAAVDADKSYYLKRTELFARFMEAVMFHPSLVERLAPVTDEAFTDLSREFPVIQDFLRVAEGGTLEHATAMFLPDLRQQFIYDFGRYVGTRAYGEEVLFRARRAKAVEEVTDLVASKFKDVKDDPSTLMTAMEGVLTSVGGSPVFGTKVRRTVNRSDEKFDDEEAAAIAADFVMAYETPEGDVVYEKWRVTPEDARRAYEALSEPGKKLVKEYAADVSEAKDVFNRELMKQTYQVVGDIEGYVHHFFEGGGKTGASTPKLRRRTASARRHRTEKEDYVRDPRKAVLKSLVDLETEKAWNEFVHRQVAMVMEPLPQGEKPRDGWVAVEGDVEKGIDLLGLKRTVIDGQRIQQGKKYQVPKWAYERYVERKLLKDEQQKMVGVLASLARYWTANTLVHPGTATTNMVSGALQYAGMVTSDFWAEVFKGDWRLSDTRADIAAALETLTPRGWRSSPDWIFGGSKTNLYHQFMDVEHADNALNRSIDGLLQGYQAIERYWKKAIVNAEARKAGGKGVFNDPEFIKAVNDIVDVWAYDYQNVPLWMQSWRKHPVGSGFKPYVTYPYKYAKMLTQMVGSAFDPNLPGNQRAAKLLALATILIAIGLAKKAMDDGHEVGKLPDDLPEGFREENLKGGVDPRGRTFVGRDDEGNEEFLRTAKYPFLNIYDVGYNLLHMDLRGAGDVLKDQAGSVGPYGQVVLNSMGWTDEFSQYEPLSTRFAETAASFVPFHRLWRSVAELTDDKNRKRGNKPQDWPDVFKEMFPLWRQTLPEREVTIPMAPGEKDGSRTTEVYPSPRFKRDVFLKEIFNVNIKRVNPEWWNNVVERERENAQKRLDKSE